MEHYSFEREAHLQQAIMRQVVRAHFLRRLLHPSLLKAYALLALGVSSLFLMSVPSVFANIAEYSWLASAQYLGNAFLHTELVVQGVLLAFVALVLWLSIDVIRQSIGSFSVPEVKRVRV